MDKNKKIKAMTLSLNPTIQSLILHMYTIFEDSRLLSSGENCDKKFGLKRQKNGQIKGRIEKGVRFSNPQYNNSLSMCISGFNILALKIPEKTPT